MCAELVSLGMAECIVKMSMNVLLIGTRIATPQEPIALIRWAALHVHAYLGIQACHTCVLISTSVHLICIIVINMQHVGILKAHLSVIVPQVF